MLTLKTLTALRYAIKDGQYPSGGPVVWSDKRPWWVRLFNRYREPLTQTPSDLDQQRLRGEICRAFLQLIDEAEARLEATDASHD